MIQKKGNFFVKKSNLNILKKKSIQTKMNHDNNKNQGGERRR